MKRFVFSLVFSLLLAPLANAQGQSWSVKLGYAPDQRVVVLSAREMGLSWEMNDAGTKLLEAGLVSSVDVVVPAPWSEDFAKWCRANPNHDVGISIAVTNPYEAIHWRLLSSEQGPTTLVDADGYPWHTVVQMAVATDPEDFKRELDAQIIRARAMGLSLTHMTGFHGTAFCRPDLAAVLLSASQKYWLPVPVVELTPELIARFQRQGFPVDEQMVRAISDYPLPKLDDIQVVPVGNTYEETRDYLCQMLTMLRPGLTEIISHPAVESEGLKRLTPAWQQRVWANQALADEKVRRTLSEQRIVVTDWRKIMQRFEAAGELVDEDPAKSLESADGEQEGEQEGTASFEGVLQQLSEESQGP